MKHILSILFLSILFSCKTSIQPTPEQNTQDTVRRSGVVEDSPAAKAEASKHLAVSADFLASHSVIAPVDAAAKGKPVRDNIAPIIDSIKPVNGTVVKGTTTISIYAHDNIGVTSYYIGISGPNYQGGANASSFTWTPVLAGNYTITGTVKDAAGNSTTKSNVVSYAVAPPPPPPTLPSSAELYHPPIMSQGSAGSCLADEQTYQYDIYYFYKTGIKRLFSAAFLYDYGKAAGDCGVGSFMLGNYIILMNKGICTDSSLSYDPALCDTSRITTAMKAEALTYKLSQWYTQYIPTDSIALKTAIAIYHKSLVFAFTSNYNIYNYTGGIINSSGASMGPHAMTIIGYDDSKHAYLCMNSWGTLWGENGLCWIDYDYFRTISGYVYSMN